MLVVDFFSLTFYLYYIVFYSAHGRIKLLIRTLHYLSALCLPQHNSRIITMVSETAAQACSYSSK